MSAVYPWCITLACDLNCSWCGSCRAVDGEHSPVADAVLPEISDEEVLVARLHGGNPFRFGDLAGWVEWLRQRGNVVIEVEGPGHDLGEPEVLERLKSVNVDAVRVMLPCADDETSEKLTGVSRYASRALDGMAAALELGVRVDCVIPMNEATAPLLDNTVLALDERFAGRVPMVLTRRPVMGGAEDPGWGEVESLADSLARLPEELPGGTELSFDTAAGYGACVVPERGWRTGLFPVPPNPGDRPLRTFPSPDLCGGCQWNSRCAWWVSSSVVEERMAPLSQAQAGKLEALCDSAGNAELDNIFREAEEDWRTGRLNAACMQYRLAVLRGGDAPEVSEAREMLEKIDAAVSDRIRGISAEIESGKVVEGMRDFHTFICEHADIPLAVEAIQQFAGLAKVPRNRELLRTRLGGAQTVVGDSEAMELDPKELLSKGLRAEITPDDTGLAPELLGMGTEALVSQCCKAGMRAEAVDEMLQNISAPSAAVLQGGEELASETRETLARKVDESCAAYPVLQAWMLAILENTATKADWNAALRFLNRASNVMRCRWVLLEVLSVD